MINTQNKWSYLIETHTVESDEELLGVGMLDSIENTFYEVKKGHTFLSSEGTLSEIRITMSP